ncbi:hypothetical protein CEUSTIGMA_g7667.t1 [Chlamydomonas eustigma]|uniref:CobW C-terminal domain-containing protein n=1 Tax=Chlamydomonas eustigma TaxID=1157962 RepID=A0A250XBF7_9CHLO|nr:hypothetical protein CEUSTIGMA_g7667.t1 [Chlamydomonas eustigma]|eukprot:GAX80229.1 hypothetical protein CEUSTIGMA_g7667.t1 [Chlamydomonas eustigma]
MASAMRVKARLTTKTTHIAASSVFSRKVCLKVPRGPGSERAFAFNVKNHDLVHCYLWRSSVRPFWSGSRHVTTAAAAVDLQAEGTDERIPVTVITGFLGSGKTTLLNNILTGAHGKRIAVIENEFGEIDIDSELVAKQEILEGSNDMVTQLSNGCLCCTVRDDLIQALNRLWERRADFDHVIIETTGLANPAPIISSFFMDADLPDRVRLDGVVTVVDAKHVELHLNEDKGEGIVNEAVEQIAYADRILLNKVDLVSTTQLSALESRLRTINEMATIQRTTRSKTPVDFVLGVGGFDLNSVEKQLNSNAGHNHDHDHEHGHDCSGAECKHESHASSHSHVHGHDCSGADCKHESHASSHNHEHGHDCSGADCKHESHASSHSHEHGHDCSGADCKHESHSHAEHSHGQAHSHSHAPAPSFRHDDKVSSVSLVLDGDMDLDKINYSLGFLLESRNEDIYRMKGILSIAGSDFRFVYHGVHMMFEGLPDRKWRPDERRVNKMVFIGRDLSREDFEEAFKSCLAPPKEVASSQKAVVV